MSVLHLTLSAAASAHAGVGVAVRDVVLARVSPLFIGSTLDAPIAYDRTPLPPYDLTSPALIALARGLSPGLLRIGGSQQDKLVYETTPGVGCAPYAPPPYPCPQQGRPACLTLRRWEELHAFSEKAGLGLVFGLNACHGRAAIDKPMDLSPTLRFLNYTASRGLKVAAFELGNELDGSYAGSDGVAPAALAADLSRLSHALATYWPDVSTRPRLLAPDVVVYTGNTGMNPYFEAMLSSGKLSAGTLSGITFHQYPYCNRPNATAHTILSLECLGKLQTAAKALTKVGAAHSLKAYAGEGSNCWTGGVRNVSDVFLDAFYYALQLSVMATHGVQAVMRQTLLGSIYQLVNATTHVPNPSYWLAMLWKRLVGSTALELVATPPLPAALHVSAHCAAANDRGGDVGDGGGDGGGVVVVAINFAADASFELGVTSADDSSAESSADLLVHELTGDLHSRTVNHNGRPLHVTSDGELPPTPPRRVVGSTLLLPPASIAFVRVAQGGSVCGPEAVDLDGAGRPAAVEWALES